MGSPPPDVRDILRFAIRRSPDDRAPEPFDFPRLVGHNDLALLGEVRLPGGEYALYPKSSIIQERDPH